MQAKARILVVEDDEAVRRACSFTLTAAGYRVSVAEDGEHALAVLSDPRQPIDAVVTDLMMPRLDGLGLLKAVKARNKAVQVIMMSGYASIENAVETTKQGAYGYLVKPVKGDALLHLVGKALEEQRLQRENERLRREIARDYERTDLLGESPRMRELFRLIEDAAGTDSTVLIQGETGSGKEMVARALHSLSRRKGQPFVAVNCGGMPETLLESELFGHMKGAFTGAIRDTQGVFQAAAGGTLLLDEITETGPPMQVKLLRVLQDKEIRPVGGTKSVKIDVRFIAATNQNMEEALKVGRFREDLYYRLNVITIELPALRERTEDIPLLVRSFLDGYRAVFNKPIEGVSTEAMGHLVSYPWPGNVRELKHAIERAVALCRGQVIGLEDLPRQVVSASEVRIDRRSGIPTLAAMEKSMILTALHESKGNQRIAAEILGIGRTTLWRKIREHGITVHAEEASPASPAAAPTTNPGEAHPR